MKKFGANNDPKIIRYVESVFIPEDDVLKFVREQSERKGLPQIQVGPMDGRHLEVLTRLVGASKAVEIGTLGGYSGVCIARGLSEGGKLYSFELSEKNADVAREAFQSADVANKVELIVGPAKDNLSKIESEGPFDLVFIDADKAGYPGYLDWTEKNLRVGGLVLGDNTLAWDLIADEQVDERNQKSVKFLRQFNEQVAQSDRFRATMLPTGEGLTAAVKIK